MQLANGLVYLYDEKVRSFIAESKNAVETISLLTFSKNYGEFFAYIDVPSGKTPYFMLFELNHKGELSSSKSIFKDKRMPITP
jgi:hypothetical protein